MYEQNQGNKVYKVVQCPSTSVGFVAKCGIVHTVQLTSLTNPKPLSLLMKISDGLLYLEKSFSTSSSVVPDGRLPTNSRLRCV